MASDSDSDGGEGRHPSPLEVAAMQLLQQRDEADGIVSAILPALQVLVSGDSTPAVQSSAIGQVADWLQQYRAFRQSQRADLTTCRSGWLKKVGTSKFTNQRRWVVLEASTLYYYADRAETQLKGVLRLPGCRCYNSKSVTDLHGHVFTVTTKAPSKSARGSALPEEVTGGGEGPAPPTACIPAPPAHLALGSAGLGGSAGAGRGLEAEVLNPLHVSKIKYRWAAADEVDRKGWVRAIQTAAGRPATEQVALQWARVLKGAMSAQGYQGALMAMVRLGDGLPPHPLSLAQAMTGGGSPPPSTPPSPALAPPRHHRRSTSLPAAAMPIERTPPSPLGQHERVSPEGGEGGVPAPLPTSTPARAPPPAELLAGPQTRKRSVSGAAARPSGTASAPPSPAPVAATGGGVDAAAGSEGVSPAACLPPMCDQPPLLSMMADWIRVVMRAGERMREGGEGGAAPPSPSPPLPASPPPPTPTKRSGGFFSSLWGGRSTSDPGAEGGATPPALPPTVRGDTGARTLGSTGAPGSPPPPSSLDPTALAAGAVSLSDLSSSTGASHATSTLLAGAATWGGSGVDGATAAADSAAAMAPGPVRMRLGGAASPSSSSPSAHGSGLREDAHAAVAVARASHAKRHAGHTPGDRVTLGQLARDLGRDTVVAGVQVHPLYVALARAHGVALGGGASCGITRHVNRHPHALLRNLTLQLLGVVAGVNRALVRQHAHPVAVPRLPPPRFMFLEGASEGGVEDGYTSDGSSSVGGGLGGGPSPFKSTHSSQGSMPPPSPPRKASTDSDFSPRGEGGGGGSEGGRPPLHPGPHPPSPGQRGPPVGDAPTYRPPPDQPAFHLTAWPYQPLDTLTAAGSLAATGAVQARALSFMREVLLCSARTVTGGDTYDAADFIFRHAEYTLLMPDSAATPPVRLVLQVLPIAMEGAGQVGDGASLPPPLLRVQLQSSMHFRLRSTDFEDAALVGPLETPLPDAALTRRFEEGDWARITAVFTRDFVWGRAPSPAVVSLHVHPHPKMASAVPLSAGAPRHTRSK